ncbi:VOC family protein [Kribbella sp. NPDC003505]|uniref:VOC family protein n=1 Tax=Kribbella sp. NPDC003505 TaxID=3154448 RepID=UPI0033B11D45
MVSRLVAMSVDCADPDRLADFWSEVLGWRVSARGWQSGPHGKTGATLSSPVRGWPEIDFRWVPDPSKSAKNRIHLDISPVDREQSAELERLLALGARRLDVGQRDVTWVVISDPEGNEFCLCRDRVEPAEGGGW